MIRQTIRNQIRSKLNETSEKFWKDDDINTTINYIYRDLINKIAEAFEGYFGETATTDFIANQSRYTIPDNFKKIQQIRVKYVSTNDWVICQRVDKETINPDSDFSQGSPIYYLFGNEFGILPSPSTTVTNGLEIDYIEEPDDISADDEVLAVPVAYHQLLLYGALADLLSEDGQEGRANRYEIKYKNGCDEMVEQVSSRDQSPRSITLVKEITAW
jgi:hypothetical protein